MRNRIGARLFCRAALRSHARTLRRARIQRAITNLSWKLR
jgi:hypothetical protein